MKNRFRKLTRTQKSLLAIPLLLLCLMVGSILHQRYWRVWSIPDVGEPFDVEAFLKQYDDIKENAFDDYSRAREQLLKMSEEADELEIEEHILNWEQTSPLLKKWLEENRPALELWLQGTEKNFGFEFHPKRCPLGTIIPVTGGMNDFSHLALLEACRLKAEGDLLGAWNMHLAILKVVRHLRQSFLLGCSIGGRQYNMQREAFSYLLADEKMSSEMLDQIAVDQQEILQSWGPISNAFKYEYFNSFTTWEAYYQYRWFPNMVFNESEAFRRVVNLGYQNNLTYCDFPRELRPDTKYHSIDFSEGEYETRFEQDCNEVFGCSMGNSGGYSVFLHPEDERGLPFQISEVEFVESVNRLKMSKKIWMLTAPHAAVFLRSEDLLRLRSEVDRIQVQLHRYHRNQVEFPESLKELVPDYLSELPMDPYHAGQPLMYGRDGREVVIGTMNIDKTKRELEFDLQAMLLNRDSPEGTIIFRIYPPGNRYDASEEKIEERIQ